MKNSLTKIGFLILIIIMIKKTNYPNCIIFKN